MSGQWPPDWEDSDTGLPDERTDSDAALDPEASEVSLFLASVPSPMLPASFEARISAAIAAEATARAGGARSDSTESAGAESVAAGIAAAGADDAKATDRSSSQGVSPAATESGSATGARHRRRRTSAGSRRAGAKSRPAGSRPGGRQRRFRLPSPTVTAPLLVVLVIVGFAVLFTRIGGDSSTVSGSFSSGTAAQGTASAASGAHADQATPTVRSPYYEGNVAGQGGQFVVTESGTRYQGSTLARQVREQLNALVTPSASVSNSASATAEPAGSASASAASSSSASAPAGAAPPGLAGCVSHLTKGVAPALVDKATYDGIPAYIIATSNRVWVVRLGCTAADPQQITSASLSG
jgi:hypothetical protein